MRACLCVLCAATTQEIKCGYLVPREGREGTALLYKAYLKRMPHNVTATMLTTVLSLGLVCLVASGLLLLTKHRQMFDDTRRGTCQS